MKRLVPGETILTTTAGPRLRCFLGIVSALIVFGSSLLVAQVDCVQPHEIPVTQVRGQVFDPFGIPVPEATVLLVPQKGQKLQTKSDGKGRFELHAPLGHYALKVEQQGFALSSAELHVGRNLLGTIHRQELRVMLGFAGSYCPWITTSKRNFLSAVQTNIKRLKDTFQTHATQK